MFFFRTILSLFILSSIIIIVFSAHAESIQDSNTKLNVYRINPKLLNEFDVIKKGTTVDLVLHESISTEQDKINKQVHFQFPNNVENATLDGIISMSTSPRRLSKNSTLSISTSKLYLSDGSEIYFPASSPVYTSVHPPHVSSNALDLARTVTTLSLAASPATFGASLGISFLVNGLLSAKQNGLSDFVWGGLNGIGLSNTENILRKQPETFLPEGEIIPFTITDDIKINKGIKKEETSPINISSKDALKKIEQLIKWGDLAGALEYSLRTNQKEKYDEILKKLSI